MTHSILRTLHRQKRVNEFHISQRHSWTIVQQFKLNFLLTTFPHFPRPKTIFTLPKVNFGFPEIILRICAVENNLGLLQICIYFAMHHVRNKRHITHHTYECVISHLKIFFGVWIHSFLTSPPFYSVTWRIHTYDMRHDSNVCLTHKQIICMRVHS